MKKRTKVALFIALSGTVAAAGVAVATYQSLTAQEREVRIAQANVDALRDTVARYVADSIATVSLMALQQSVAQDSIADLLVSLRLAIDGREQTLRSLQTLRVEFDRLRGEFESVEVEEHGDELDPGEDQRQFSVTGPPIEGTVRVVYRPREPWSLFTDLGVTPFSQTYNIGCDELHRAIVNITNPSWVHPTLERGVVDPNLCNPPRPPRPLFAFSFDRAVWTFAGIGIGVAGKLLYDKLFDNDSRPSYDYHYGR